MVRNCVENIELKILSEFKLNKTGMGDGPVSAYSKPKKIRWVEGWKSASKSRVQDCLQQSKITFKVQTKRRKAFQQNWNLKEGKNYF